MKKTACMLVGAGILLLVFLSLLFPVPDVGPLRYPEDNPVDKSERESYRSTLQEKTDAGGEGIKAGSFVFPYYATSDADDPLWVFRGSEAMVAGKKLDRVKVKKPNVIYFPGRRTPSDADSSPPSQKSSSRSGGPRKVRIRGRQGKMITDHRVRLRGDVSVRTDRGGRVRADALFANFKSNRIFTNRDDRATLEQYGMSVTGTGLSGRPELSSFRIRRNGELTLSARRLRSKKALRSKPAPTRVQMMNRIYVRTDGRIDGQSRRGDGSSGSRTSWDISLRRNVFLYRIRPSGNYQQRSERLRMILRESPSGGGPDDASSETRLQLRSMTAREQVRVSDPFFEIHTDRMRVGKQKQRDVIRLKGRQQRIVLKEGVPRPGVPAGDTTGTAPRHDDKQRTTVLVRGTGTIIRPRPASTSGGSDGESVRETPTGTATFEGRVIVRTKQATLQARKLTITFGLPSDAPRRDRSNRTGSSDRRLSIRSMVASGNVLLLRNQIASTGRRMTLNRRPTSLRIESDQKSRLVDLRNQIEAKAIELDHQNHTLTAHGNASATFRAGSGRNLRLFGNRSTGKENIETGSSPASNTDGRHPWHIDAETLEFAMNPANNRLQSVRARTNVHLRTQSGNGRGDTFTFDRRSGTAILKGGENTPHARLLRDGNRVVAGQIRFDVRRGNVVLKGEKRLRLNMRRTARHKKRPPSGPDDQAGGENEHRPTEHIYITTGAPVVVHRERGVLRVLGRSTLRRPGGWMRSDRMTLRFDPETRALRSAVARGTVVARDRLGSLSGDVVWWWPRSERLRVRGRPTARIQRGTRTMAFDEITLLRKKSVIRGRSNGSDRGSATLTASGKLLSTGTRPGKEKKQTTWHVRARRMSFSFDEKNSKLRTFRARGDVWLTSSQGNARGHRLLFNHARSRLTLYGKDGYAQVRHGPHRIAADRILYETGSEDVVLKGRKQIRLVPSSESKEQKGADETAEPSPPVRSSDPGETGPGGKVLHVRTRAPTVLHRAEGVLRILGASRVYRNNAHLRSRDLTAHFNPDTRTLRAVRADGEVFLNHQKGALYGDQARWNVKKDLLNVRGQPFATGLFGRMRFRFELITVSEDWGRFSGRWYKWRRHGTARIRNVEEGTTDQDLP